MRLPGRHAEHVYLYMFFFYYYVAQSNSMLHVLLPCRREKRQTRLFICYYFAIAPSFAFQKIITQQHAGSGLSRKIDDECCRRLSYRFRVCCRELGFEV